MISTIRCAGADENNHCQDAKSADIVVITAGAGVKPGQTRLDLVQLIFNCSPKIHNTKA